MAWAYHPEERAAIFSAQISHVASMMVKDNLKKAQEALTEEVEGCSRPFTEDGLRRKEIPNFCMGVIAGVRYCESAESGRTDKGRELHYATAISHANTVSSTWADQGIRCGLNMGNIIDRRAGDRAKAALNAIKIPLCDTMKTQSWRWRIQEFHQTNDFQGDTLHLMGPHDLEHLSPAQITCTLSKSRFQSIGREYFAVSPCKGWVLIFLDTYELNLMSKDMETRIKARDILEAVRRKKEREYSTECGAVGPEQLKWLRATVEGARDKGEYCVVMSHSPLEPKLANRGKKDLLCWNWHEVQDALHSAAGAVILCLSGQQEDSLNAVCDKSNRKMGVIEHVSIANAILSKPGTVTYSVLELHDGGKVELRGFGDNTSYTILPKPIVKSPRPL